MLNYFAREESRGKQETTKIKEIPHLTSPLRISQLNFSHNDIRAIPPHIVSVKNLQMIDLSHNKISKIEHLWQITSIKFVNLSYNLISEVPMDMLHLTEVENIDLGFNKIAILNNIKVLKKLVEIRMFEKNGFIEINLEGNEILKKKGCRDIYKKWMNPSLEDYQRHSRNDQSDGHIHLTKKRNSRSLEMPLKDNSMIQTHRSHLLSQKLEEARSMQNKRKRAEEKIESAMKASLHTEKLSPNLVTSQNKSALKQNPFTVKSQMLNGFYCFQDLSKVFQSTTIEDISNIAEWFCLCVDQLNDLGQKFSLITENDDANSLTSQIKEKLKDESSHARKIIFVCLELVKEAVDNKLKKETEERLLKQILNVDRKIKLDHDIILKQLGSSTQVLPIKLYKVWVALYRKLKSITYQLPEKIALHRVKYARQQQIQQLLSISPDKGGKLIFPSNEKRQPTCKNDSNQKYSASNDKLDDLLFSRNKSECLLLSDNQNARATSEKKSPNRQKAQCENCLMLKWITNKTKDQITELSDKVQHLEKQRDQHVQLIQNLSTFKEKYLTLASKQELIIGELQYLNPSTYQNFLLEQAKTIQYMLHTNDLVDYRNIAITNPSKAESLRAYTSKQISKDKEMLLNTRLSSTNKNGKAQSDHNKVSEFSIEGKQDIVIKESNNTIKSSYFKNKNIVTTVNRTNQDPKTKIMEEYLVTEQNHPRKQQINRQEVVVSQFNSQVNSLQNTSNKNKNITFEQFSTEKNENQIKQEEGINDIRKATQNNSKGENDIILISQASELKNVSLERLQTLKLGNNQNKSKMLSYLKSEQFNQIMRAKLIDPPEKPRKCNIQKQNSQNYHLKPYAQRKSSQKHSSRVNSELANKQNSRPENIKRNKTAERFYQDGHHQSPFVALESSEAENYKRYMKYHLRNNIIEILFKKNNFIAEQAYQDRVIHPIKQPKLINKKNTTDHSHMEEQLSKRSQINKTFR